MSKPIINWGPVAGLGLTLGPWCLVGALWYASAERHDAEAYTRAAEREAKAHAAYCAARRARHAPNIPECPFDRRAK